MPLLATLNALPKDRFVEVLGGVFEKSPWIPEQVWPRRPFASTTALCEAMCDVVATSGAEAQLGLIRAHPDLAGKAALAGDVTAASSAEQAGAGLDRLSEDEYGRFHTLNDRYRDRFGFPFVLAVKGHTKTSILAAFEARLPNSPEAERERALAEIYQIARFRLEGLAE